MRAKINGKCYDTSTGTMVCQCDRGYLYKKYHANEFFLYDRKQTITPISWDEAKAIVIKWGSRVFYTNFFDPSDNPRRTNMDMDIVTYNKIRDIAGTEHKTMKEALREIVDKAWRNRNRHIR